MESYTVTGAHNSALTVNFKLVVHKNAILKCELTNHIRQTWQFCWMWLVNLKFNVAFLDNQPEIYGTLLCAQVFKFGHGNRLSETLSTVILLTVFVYFAVPSWEDQGTTWKTKRGNDGCVCVHVWMYLDSELNLFVHLLLQESSRNLEMPFWNHLACLHRTFNSSKTPRVEVTPSTSRDNAFYEV